MDRQIGKFMSQPKCSYTEEWMKKVADFDPKTMHDAIEEFKSRDEKPVTAMLHFMKMRA